MSAPFQYAQCANLKTAIAERIQEIVGQSERWLADSDNVVAAVLPRGQFDPSQGPNPRRLRYGFAPAEEREYAPLLVQGDVAGNMTGADCSGADRQYDTTVNRTGAYGCDLPGQEVEGGFDVFSHEVKGKAFETGWVCALDLLLKESYNSYLEGLQKGLKREAIKHHGWALERDVIGLAKYNTSVVDGWTSAQGTFPAVPTGGLNFETVSRTFAILKAEGWTGSRVVRGISREAFEEMRRVYRLQKGYEVHTNPASMETETIPPGATAIEWNGINWVFSDFPTRGYLRANPDGSQVFVPIRPTMTRPGTGGGVVPTINPDYYNCKTFCDGVAREIFEVAYMIHPDFAKVLSFSMPTVGGKSWSGQLFNLDLRMIDGPDVTNRFGVQNLDNFKFFTRALHAYSFEPGDPELASAIIYRVSPYSPDSVAPVCITASAGTPVGFAPAFPQQHDGTQSCGNANDPVCDLASFPVVPGTQTEVCPGTLTEGRIKFVDCGAITTSAGTTLRVCVERVDGFNGPATISIATTAGTATDGVDYVGIAATALEWQDGEGGFKCVDIEILDAATDAQNFTVALTTPTGAALDLNCDSVLVTFDNP